MKARWKKSFRKNPSVHVTFLKRVLFGVFSNECIWSLFPVTQKNTKAKTLKCDKRIANENSERK